MNKCILCEKEAILFEKNGTGYCLGCAHYFVEVELKKRDDEYFKHACRQLAINA